MSYLSNTYITPGKDQISMALVKVRRVFELYKPIHERLQNETVEVKSWWGAGWNVIKVIWGGRWDELLRKDTSGKLMTKEEHIRKANENSFMPFYGRAFLLGYITAEEYQICRFLMEAPGVKTLQKWETAETVYLCEDDHQELMFALSEEI